MARLIERFILTSTMSFSVITDPDFGFTVLKLDVLLQSGWITMCLLGFRLIYVMVSHVSPFLEVMGVHL